MAKTVTNISKLSPLHFVSNIRHQHRCSRPCFVLWTIHFNTWPSSFSPWTAMMHRLCSIVLLLFQPNQVILSFQLQTFRLKKFQFLVLSNYVFNIIYPLYNILHWNYIFFHQNCETSTVQTSVEHQSLPDSILTRLKFLSNFTSILPWIRAKVDKTKDTTW